MRNVYRSFVPHVPAIELNSNVVHIDPSTRRAITADGRAYHWRILISTMPLPVLTRVVSGTPLEIRELADQLDYLSLRVELLLASRSLETPIQRIYVADAEIPPHKVALNHNSSDHLRARPRHAIMAEVSVSRNKSVRSNEIAPRTIDLLCDVGVLGSRSDVCWTHHLDVRFGYPVYTHNRLELVGGIKEWMSKHGILTLGRFGDWEYINSDKCVMKGLRLGTKLKQQFSCLQSDTQPDLQALFAG